MQAGKDVYCEKPLTLTIDEGKQIIKVLEGDRARLPGRHAAAQRNGRSAFLQADRHDPRRPDRQGQEGDLRHRRRSDQRRRFPKAAVPSGLNWDMWLGQAPLVDYRFKDTAASTATRRCHYEFRWWYEYSGGKMTDWGAHHVDIATWAIGMDETGPDVGRRLTAEHPVPVQGRHARRATTATTRRRKFDVPR